MIENIQEATKELTETLKKFQEKYQANFVELKQVVDYALDAISSPPSGTEVLTPKGEAEAKAKQDKADAATAKAESKHQKSPATDLK